MGVGTGFIQGWSSQIQGFGGGTQRQTVKSGVTEGDTGSCFLKSEVPWTADSGIELYDPNSKWADSLKRSIGTLLASGAKPYVRTYYDDTQSIYWGTPTQHKNNITNMKLFNANNNFKPSADKPQTGFKKYWAPTSNALNWYFSPFTSLANKCGYGNNGAVTFTTGVLDACATAATWFINPIIPFINVGMAMFKGGMDCYYS